MDSPLYWNEPIPAFLQDALTQKALTRLKNVGMHCGLEYTSFPYFSRVLPYHRFEHSLGVALLAYRFSNSKVQALAGLYHDISTPVFAHVVDFLLGDASTQEATEKPTASILLRDKEIAAYLTKERITVPEIEDYHRYPICDNPSPKLSCDRLEYTFSNFVNFGVYDVREVQEILFDIEVGRNESGEEELVFAHREIAEKFGFGALICSDYYSRKEDRYAMEALSVLLQEAIRQGVFQMEELYTLDEIEAISRIRQSPLASSWEVYRSLKEVATYRKQTPFTLFTKVVSTKKRFIDPYVKGGGRLSIINENFATKLKEFTSQSMEEELTGIASIGLPSLFC